MGLVLGDLNWCDGGRPSASYTGPASSITLFSCAHTHERARHGTGAGKQYPIT